MASTSATSPLDPGGGEPLEHFHRFPDLPPEIRIQIWQKAYRALHYTPVYRFRLKFSHTQGTEEEKKPKAFLVPLEELGYLTKGIRSLRRVNSESRFEGDRFFGRYTDSDYLRFNQTEKGDASNICHPINLPWRGVFDLFCFVGLTEDDVICLQDADTSLIDHVFSKVQAIGLGLDRTLEVGTDGFDYLADFILLFSEIRHASLVSDLLMSEADLDNINNEIRSDYLLTSWFGWHGMVPEEVFDADCEDASIVTKDQHLDAVIEFIADMIARGDDDPECAGALLRLTYGIMFRTKQCLDDLLWSDRILDEIAEENGSLDDEFDAFEEQFSDDLSEFSEASEAA